MPGFCTEARSRRKRAGHASAGTPLPAAKPFLRDLCVEEFLFFSSSDLHKMASAPCPLYPQQQTFERTAQSVEKCQ